MDVQQLGQRYREGERDHDSGPVASNARRTWAYAKRSAAPVSPAASRRESSRDIAIWSAPAG